MVTKFSTKKNNNNNNTHTLVHTQSDKRFIHSMSISTDRTAVESPNIQSVCVYCASSNKIHKKFFDAANELGASLALNKVSIRYGGGNTGLMGAIAKSCLENGGKVIGVIPRFMWDNKVRLIFFFQHAHTNTYTHKDIYICLCLCVSVCVCVCVFVYVNI